MRTSLILAPVVVALALSPLFARDQVSPKFSITRGAQDYQAYGCAACHGTTGAGGGWQGPKLAPEPLPIEAFTAQLREPVAKMPRYSRAVLSDAQVEAIHAYLRSVPSGKRAADIPVLNR